MLGREKTSFVVLLVSLSICPSYASKILVLHPMYAASHVLTLRALAKGLVARGHEVTVLRWKDTHQYPDANHPNIREHVLAINNTEGAIPHLTVEERASFQMPQEIMWSKGTSWTALPVDMFLTISAFCKSLLEREQLREDLRNEQFDIAIVDVIYNECSLALAHDLGLPSVGYWAFTFSGGEPQYTTAFSPPSCVPMILSHCPEVMNFWERLWNHFLAFSSHVVMQTQFAVTSHQIRKYLPSSPWPADLLSNLSGMLINTHPAVDNPRLLPPSFISVGGMQIRPPQPLPQDLEDFIAGSGDAGVILFTMGFIFNPKTVPLSVIQAFMGAFGRLEQRVLVKLEGTFEHTPPNVKVVDWLPQQDILAHRKTVLFFTHCGMHGVLEALHYGVPMVGMPVFADQEDVLIRLQERGVAKGVHKQASEDEIFQAIKDVLNDSRYRQNALRLSRVLRDQIQSPQDHALWLVEHVINTKGADHLKTAARHLNFVQFFGLDILAFVLLVSYVFWRYVKPFLRCMFCLFKKKVKSD
ncbi:UDP-glucuronosyltransferase 2A3-like [Penaeus japonicus]|uniref:UDP-glucuronosyltransferase 2A3-like n=1 Tax=Penaeus japonicus TaxID=27405 RepID=UPI001C715704|nr:UDP-glucuronosyltransferase 2A3-like [Penaeus japonicus]